MNMIGFVSGHTYFDTSQTLGKTSTSRTGYVYFMLIVVCVFYDISFAAAAQTAAAAACCCHHCPPLPLQLPWFLTGSVAPMLLLRCCWCCCSNCCTAATAAPGLSLLLPHHCWLCCYFAAATATATTTNVALLPVLPLSMSMYHLLYCWHCYSHQCHSCSCCFFCLVPFWSPCGFLILFHPPFSFFHFLSFFHTAITPMPQLLQRCHLLHHGQCFLFVPLWIGRLVVIGIAFLLWISSLPTCG